MTWFDALLGKIYNAGSEIELGTGLNFTGALRAAANAVTGLVDVTLADAVSLAKATIGSLVLTPSAPIAISSGAISAPGGYVIVDTEGAAATDNLDTISTSYGGVPHVEGTVLVISQANSSRDVTIRHGVGNIKTWKGTSVALGNTGGIAVLVYRASGWQCVGSYTDAQAASIAVQALSSSGAISAGALNLPLQSGTYTIAGGAISAPTGSTIAVDTEGAAAADDLDTIGASDGGRLLLLRTSASARVVTLRDFTVSGGNIVLPGAAPVVINASWKPVLLVYFAGSWHLLSKGTL